MDEVLEYVTKAAGIKVGGNTLAAQTIAFMQELTETAGNLNKVCLVVTLPSSIVEHYDESADRLYMQLQKVAGRVEKIYTPVQENEISKVVRRRLFSDIKESEAKKIITGFIQGEPVIQVYNPKRQGDRHHASNELFAEQIQHP